MISVVLMIYIQDRIIGICIAYPARVRFGVVNTTHFTKLLVNFIKIHKIAKIINGKVKGNSKKSIQCLIQQSNSLILIYLNNLGFCHIKKNTFELFEICYY